MKMVNVKMMRTKMRKKTIESASQMAEEEGDNEKRERGERAKRERGERAKRDVIIL